MSKPYTKIMTNNGKLFTHAFRTYMFKKSGGTCEYCGTALRSRDEMFIDHVVPRSLQGSNDERNLRAACVSCNSQKGHRTLGYLRAVLRLRSTKLEGIITPAQLMALEELGASLPIPPTFVFHFEMDQA